MLARLSNPLLTRSFFLFGARGTGKTTLLKNILDPKLSHNINLLLPSDYDEFALNPELLINRVSALKDEYEWVVIDEVQKLPRLLDIVHHLMVESKIKFALTGSSARKLKRTGANLLAGRASVYNLFPLSYLEIGKQFSLSQTLEWGTLPEVINSNSNAERSEYLKSYAFTYLKEEISEEQAVRKIEPFRKFLAVAAQSNGKLINYNKISQDVGTSAVTVKTYFSILEDTLLGFLLEPFHESVRKSQRQSPKFYFIDAGIERALSKSLDIPVREGTYQYGAAFEAFFINEVFKINSYTRKDFKLYYLRTKDDAEIDLVIERPQKERLIIEIKSSSRILENDTTTLKSFASSMQDVRAIVVSQDPNPKQFGQVSSMHWQDGLKEIFGDLPDVSLKL